MPLCLQCGIKLFDFWDYTLQELNQIMDAYNQSEMRRMKEQAVNTYQLANLIGASVARLMDNDAKFPDIAEVFPNLFDTEEERARREEQEQAIKWQREKAWLMRYAEAHNKKTEVRT